MFVDGYGYCVLRYKNGKMIFAHRSMMEFILKRKLRSDEVVHHIDGRRWNNCPFNLKLVSPAQHMDIHRVDWESGRRTSYYTSNSLLWSLIQHKNKLGRWPVYKEQKIPNATTYWRHFGGWRAAIKAARQYEKELQCIQETNHNS